MTYDVDNDIIPTILKTTVNAASSFSSKRNENIILRVTPVKYATRNVRKLNRQLANPNSNSLVRKSFPVSAIRLKPQCNIITLAAVARLQYKSKKGMSRIYKCYIHLRAYFGMNSCCSYR